VNEKTAIQALDRLDPLRLVDLSRPQSAPENCEYGFRSDVNTDSDGMWNANLPRPGIGPQDVADAAGPDQWRVRQDFETALRAMQRLGDRQKILAAHGVPVSDTRLPLVMFDLRNCTTLEGRILVHGEDEGTGRSFMMLEGTDAKVHCIYHTPQMAEARGRGGLRANRFVRLRKLFENRRPVLEIDELGRSEKILSNRHHHEETARRLLQSGMASVEDGWGGWLGRYQSALRKAAIELEDVRQPSRERDHSRGR
jgi:Protein of unknown function (DUF3363)